MYTTATVTRPDNGATATRPDDRGRQRDSQPLFTLLKAACPQASVTVTRSDCEAADRNPQRVQEPR